MSRRFLGLLALLAVVAGAAPASAQAPIRLTFVGDRGLRVHRYLGTDQVLQRYTRYVVTSPTPLQSAWTTSPRDRFEALCDLPCTVDVAPGRLFHFGVSEGYGMAFRGGDTYHLAESATFRVGYEDRTWVRVIGWITFIGGMVAGLGFVGWGAVTDQISDPLPWALPAIGAGVVGMALGIPLIALTDHASVELVTPW
ncbi:MAG: hypothetical protein R3B82_07880 [Sandaracinaceae bacterium]